MRVLVIEDNMDAAETMALVLQDMGHEVEFALTGNLGLSVAHQFRPEVVFLDIRLPDVSGYEIAGRLRREAGVPAAKIIAMTGRPAFGDRALAFEAGCDHYILKPLDPAFMESLLQPRLKKE
jgi:DNA-binding response OmpR family regulator